MKFNNNDIYSLLYLKVALCIRTKSRLNILKDISLRKVNQSLTLIEHKLNNAKTTLGTRKNSKTKIQQNKISIKVLIYY